MMKYEKALLLFRDIFNVFAGSLSLRAQPKNILKADYLHFAHHYLYISK